MFAQQKCTLPQGKHKIIILDEADSMTEGAQQVNIPKIALKVNRFYDTVVLLPDKRLCILLLQYFM